MTRVSLLLLPSLFLLPTSPSPVDPTFTSYGPCDFPMFNTPQHTLFCQTNYHNTPLLCDPGGLLSRTEAELIATSIRKANLTTHLGPARVAVAVVPVTSITSLTACVPSLAHHEPPSLSAAAFEFARRLFDRWGGDMLVVYIREWAPHRRRAPFLITQFGGTLHRLSHHSLPSLLPARLSARQAILQAIHDSAERLHTQQQQKVMGVPRWAVFGGGGLLMAVSLVWCISNSIIERVSDQKNRRRFRPSKVGGTLVNATASKNRVMLFTAFSKKASAPQVNRL